MHQSLDKISIYHSLCYTSCGALTETRNPTSRRTTELGPGIWLNYSLIRPKYLSYMHNLCGASPLPPPPLSLSLSPPSLSLSLSLSL